MMMKIFPCGLCFLCAVLVVDFVSSTVELTLPTRTVSIDEKENRRLGLLDSSDPISCRDTGGALTRAWLDSVSPSSPCSSCFTVEPCHDTNHWVFCLVYQAGQGQFSFSAVQSYTAVIACTDDVLTAPITDSLQVVVISNLAPQFDPPVLSESITVTNTRDKRQGDLVFEVLTRDSENDAVFFDMQTEPDTDLFTISHGSGRVRAAQDLRYLCTSRMLFRITIWDSYHNPGLPKDIQVTFQDINDRPVITNTDHTLRVVENANPISAIGEIVVEDDYLYPEIYLDMTSLIPEAFDLYYVTGGKLRVRRPLDYEYEALREVSVSLRAFDGFCYSDFYDVRVVIDDINEDFLLQPVFMEPDVYEGIVNYKPNVTIVDQDAGGVYTFRKVTGNAKVSVQSSTGLLTSSVIEVNPKDKKNVPVTVEVQETTADPAHAHTFEVNMTMLDINDKIPEFSKKTYEFKVDNCTEVGEVVGKVGANDDDSSLNGNNYVLFSGGGAAFSVLADGSVLYTSLIAVGEVSVGSASVTDMGLVPGPLEGSAATVVLTCKECKEKDNGDSSVTTTTEWTGPRNVDPSEILRATDTSTNARSWQSNNVGWMAASATLLVLWAILVGLMIWKHARCCRTPKRPRQVTWSDHPKGNSGQQTGPHRKQQQQQLQQTSETGPWGLPQQTAPFYHQQPHQQLSQATAPPQYDQLQPSQQQQQQQQQSRSDIFAITDETMDVPMQPPSLFYPLAFQEKEKVPPAAPRGVMAEARSPPEKEEPSKDPKPPKFDKPSPVGNSTSTDTKPPQETTPSEDASELFKLKPSEDSGERSPDNNDTLDDGKIPPNYNPFRSTLQPVHFKPTVDKRDRTKARQKDPARPGRDKAGEPLRRSPPEEIYHKPQMHMGDYIDLEILTPRNSPLPGKDKW